MSAALLAKYNVARAQLRELRTQRPADRAGRAARREDILKLEAAVVTAMMEYVEYQPPKGNFAEEVAAMRQRLNAIPKHECCVCLEEKPLTAFRANSCGHRQCRDCFLGMVAAADSPDDVCCPMCRTNLFTGVAAANRLDLGEGDHEELAERMEWVFTEYDGELLPQARELQDAITAFEENNPENPRSLCWTLPMTLAWCDRHNYCYRCAAEESREWGSRDEYGFICDSCAH
jgi:hypothetical protein